jgi:glycosyltransferase involved in cell wall biosynthesis
MRVMHFHFGKDGGAERFFVHLLNALAERGIEQKIVIRPGRVWKTEIHGSVDIIESHFRTFSIDRLTLPLRVAALARRWKPDGMLGWMPKGAKLMPAVQGPARLARLGDYPVTLRRFEQIETLICNTPGIAAHVKAMGWERGIEVITNFTSTQRFAPIARRALDTPEDAFVIASMGRFVPRKGFDVLIRALADLPGAYFWLIGSGGQQADLRALAQQLGVLDRVRFTGWQAEPRPMVAASDCLAMASSHEPLGNVILEAWAQHVPVVSTRSEGPIWYMRDGENGLLVDIGDHNGFARAFARLRDDPALSRQLVAEAARTLDQRFSRDAIVAAYMRVLASGAAA